VNRDLKIHAGDKLLFVGDSITDCDYRGAARPLGNGYVQFTASLINVAQPNLEVRIVNRGNSGDTIMDLKARWEEDVIREKPDTLYIMIGVNDVMNRYNGEKRHLAVDDATFGAVYRELVSEALDRIAPRIILLEPTCLESPLDAPPNRDLGRLAKIVGQVGGEFKLDVLPLYQRLSMVVSKGWSKGWYADPAHPHFSGHLLVALTIMEHLGLRVLPFPR
jgi:lysophospholipase L1-like esterase